MHLQMNFHFKISMKPAYVIAGQQLYQLSQFWTKFLVRFGKNN